MTVRACMLQNLGKYFKVIAKDGYILFRGRVTRDVIDTAVKWGWLNDKVLKEEYGREYDGENVRYTVVVTIE